MVDACNLSFFHTLSNSSSSHQKFITTIIWLVVGVKLVYAYIKLLLISLVKEIKERVTPPCFRWWISEFHWRRGSGHKLTHIHTHTPSSPSLSLPSCSSSSTVSLSFHSFFYLPKKIQNKTCKFQTQNRHQWITPISSLSHKPFSLHIQSQTDLVLPQILTCGIAESKQHSVVGLKVVGLDVTRSCMFWVCVVFLSHWVLQQRLVVVGVVVLHGSEACVRGMERK